MNNKNKKNKTTKTAETTKSIKVRDSIKDFDIQINSFGEIVTNYDVDKINAFLDKNVQDKKLIGSGNAHTNTSDEL